MGGLIKLSSFYKKIRPRLVFLFCLEIPTQKSPVFALIPILGVLILDNYCYKMNPNFLLQTWRSEHGPAWDRRPTPTSPHQRSTLSQVLVHQGSKDQGDLSLSQHVQLWCHAEGTCRGELVRGCSLMTSHKFEDFSDRPPPSITLKYLGPSYIVSIEIIVHT